MGQVIGIEALAIEPEWFDLEPKVAFDCGFAKSKINAMSHYARLIVLDARRLLNEGGDTPSVEAAQARLQVANNAFHGVIYGDCYEAQERALQAALVLRAAQRAEWLHAFIAICEERSEISSPSGMAL